LLLLPPPPVRSELLKLGLRAGYPLGCSI
jgi:hypothetical protein